MTTRAARVPCILAVTIAAAMTAAQPVAAQVRVSSIDEVRQALRAALRIRHQDWPVFDEEFRRLWLPDEAQPKERSPQHSTAPVAHRQRPAIGELPAIDGAAPESETPEGEQPGYSPDALLRKKPFEECTPRELRELERMVDRMRLQLATRPSRRLVPARACIEVFSSAALPTS